jgi:hypothetical protein
VGSWNNSWSPDGTRDGISRPGLASGLGLTGSFGCCIAMVVMSTALVALVVPLVTEKSFMM